jgi:16S rRNA processing protein RimM
VWPVRATGSRPTSTSSTTEGDDAGAVPPGDPQPPPEGVLLEVGVVVRPHGLRGDTVVHFSTNRTERTEGGAEFETDIGTLRIEHLGRSGRRWIVRFAGVDSLEQAEAIRGTVLRAQPIPDPDALWVHELVGAQVVDAADGKILGSVSSVLPNPASDLLELDGGGLVPLRFVVAHEPGRVTVDIPRGLLD